MILEKEPIRKPETYFNRSRVVAWALYDWGNSAFATTVMAGFFPVFFKQHWSEGLADTENSFWLGTANSLASLVIMVLAPVLGAIADQNSTKKHFLIFFAVVGIVTTGGLYFVAKGDWAWALVLYGLALLGFSGGNSFYDALIVTVAGARHLDFVSALGFAMGYLGGGLLFAVNVLMVLYPTFFGFSDVTSAVRVAFVTVALWWAVFSLPLLLFVPEPLMRPRLGGWQAVSGGFRQLRKTFQEIRRLRMVGTFLLAYWLYIDGVDTVVRMAVDYGLALGFDANSLMVALLITQFVGFPAALVFGKLGERLGTRTGIFIAIGVYVLVTIWAYFIRHPWEFYVLASVIGLVQGGIQALSRSFYARLIPEEKAGEFFGFYNMLGKFAAVIGPVLMGWVGLLTGSTRLSILALLVLFLGGALLLTRVDETEGYQMAKTL
jgi:UMF1 family MFS transporter